MNRSDLVKIVLYYLFTILLVLGFEYIVFMEFGFGLEIFGAISLAVLGFAVLFGYIMAKFALEPLLATTRLLDRLLKDTLHELNIPVATIMANVSMLKKGQNDPKSLARLERIQKASENLLQLYEDLDYFIKKEIRKVDYDLFDLKELTLERLAHFEDIIKNHRLTVRTQLEPLLIKADRRGFSKAIDNLLSNAVKYNSPEGTIEVILGGSKLLVRDSGIGMSDEELLRIFDRYYQAGSEAQGYGIGMNIVKSFCDDHKIFIHIDSQKGQGTSVCLDLAAVVQTGQTG